MPVNFRSWVSESVENISDSPKRGLLQSIYCAYLGGWFTVTSRSEIGTNIFDRDWDVLLILDACRVDALREVADEYDFIGNVDSVWSVGSGSYEWMVKTFNQDHLEEIQDTAYLTANGFSQRAFVEHQYAPSVSLPFGFPKYNVVHDSDFGHLDQTWKEGHDGSKLHTVPPKFMTDRAITYQRSNPRTKRLIVHYAQPHIPYILDAMNEDREVTDIERSPFDAARRGTLSYDKLWSKYMDTLRVVLDEVEVLLENIDAETVVISADHGEALGELRCHGHPTGFPHPVVKKVPWVETTATDEGTREPDTELAKDSTSPNVEDHLRDLGYM